MVPAESTSRDVSSAAGDALGVVVDRQTWKNLLYALIAIPVGMTYYGLVFFGIVFGVLLSVVGVGFAILAGTFIGARGLAGFERWQANALLGLDLDPADDVDSGASDGPVATVRRYLDAPSTWRGLGFVVVKFPFGVAAIALLVVLSGAVTLLTAPVRYPFEAQFGTVNEEPVTWSIGTLPEAALALALGAVLSLLVLHAANGYAYVARRMAQTLLDADASAEPRSPESPD